MKNPESGRSMIEMLGVLSIVGVLSVGGLAGYAKAVQKHKISKVEMQLTTTMQSVRKYFPHSYYASLGAMALKDSLGLTAFEKVDGVLIHAIGGSATVAECSEFVAEDSEAFCIVLHNIDKSACVEIMSQSWGGKIVAAGVISSGCYEESSVLDSQANIGQIKRDGATTIAYRGALPMSTSDTAQACSGNDNTLFFKMK